MTHVGWGDFTHQGHCEADFSLRFNAHWQRNGDRKGGGGGGWVKQALGQVPTSRRRSRSTDAGLARSREEDHYSGESPDIRSRLTSQEVALVTEQFLWKYSNLVLRTEWTAVT